MDIINYHKSKYETYIKHLTNIDKFIKSLQDIYNSMYNNTFEVEGNYYYTINNPDPKHDIILNNLGYHKIANLLWAIKVISDNNQNKLNICEIGFNAGHSASIIATALENIDYNFYFFDITLNTYVRPCFQLFNKKFKNDNNKFEFIEGDSIITLPKFINDNDKLINTFDFIHIDGGHNEECITNDLKNADMLIKKGGIIVIDDTHLHIINNQVDYYIQNKNYQELFFLDLMYFMYPHRIIQKK